MHNIYIILLVILVVQATYQYPSRKLHEEYDYIIVGAGSAGSVLANRLSENDENQVLLLEAGGPPRGETEVPLLSTTLIAGPEDWGYWTEPQQNACLGLKNQRSYWSRFKALGGCSSHNTMMYVRGNPRDFDAWEEMGARGWNWKEVKKYFLKSEGQTDEKIKDNGYHNSDGLQTVSAMKSPTKLLNAYLKAAEHLGYKIGDYNGESQLVFSPIQVTQRDGLRCSTEKAFLRPAGHRPNLDILTHAHVTKIIFDSDKTARKVSFERMNTSQVVSAKKEIILSAGAIGSPHLLLLSGVGPKEHLAKFNIPVVADLPVGQNLLDHVAAGGMSFFINDSAGIVVNRDVNTKTVGALFDQEGVMTAPGAFEGVGFVQTKHANKTNEQPDIELHLISAYFSHSWEFNEKMLESVAPYENENATSCMPTLLHPRSKGFIELRSTDPYEHPVIQPNYITAQEDVDKLLEGLKVCEAIFGAPNFLEYSPVRAPKVIPGCEEFDADSDEYKLCLIRTLTYTVLHYGSTCKMGNPEDSTTVVDPELRVKGVKNLRVADMSIAPTLTSGNTNAPAIMIGEKAADMIRGIKSV